MENYLVAEVDWDQHRLTSRVMEFENVEAAKEYALHVSFSVRSVSLFVLMNIDQPAMDTMRHGASVVEGLKEKIRKLEDKLEERT